MNDFLNKLFLIPCIIVLYIILDGIVEIFDIIEEIEEQNKNN